MMKHAIFFVSLALAVTAVAQQQIHVVGGVTPYMFKAEKVKNISYKGNAAEGYSHMVVTDKNDAATEVALTDDIKLAILHEGVADPTIVPVEASSDEFRLLTARQWSFAGASGNGYSVSWLDECVNDDKLSFTADGKVLYDLGANNNVYCEFSPSPKTFTATGDEAFVLGRKNGVLLLQFIGGAFPIYRGDIKGRGAVYSMAEPYEVLNLTDTSLQIKAGLPDNDYVLISFEREPSPEPKPLTNLTLLKASFVEDEFNMVSEPGFELFPDEDIDYRSLWYFEGAFKTPKQASKHTQAHGGLVALKLDNPNDGSWCDACLQSVALKKGQDYTFSCFGQASWADMNVFTGVRIEGGPIYDGKAGDWNPDMWTEFTKEFNSGDFTQGNVYCGAWGWPGVWVAVDDFKLVPTGAAQTSTKPSSCMAVGTISNASLKNISSVGKAVVWKGPDNTLSMALSNIMADGKHYDNAFATSGDVKVDDGLSISYVSPGNDGIVPVIEPSGADETSCVPTAGVTINGKQYIHYYSLKAIDPEDNDVWTANFAGLLSSEDGGKTWACQTSGCWSGAGHFVQVAFYQNDGYLYMFGSDAGRSTSKIYVARIKADGDIANASNWTYWDGSEWMSGDPDAAAAVTYGNASEMCVTYHQALKRYILIYRSSLTGGLVYRDAGSPEGDWSGQKLLMFDNEHQGGWFSPSVYPFASGNDIYFIASQL